MDVKQIPNCSTLLVRLRNGEHYLFHKNVLGDVTEEIAEANYLTTPRTLYAGEFLREEAVYNEDKGSTYTSQVTTTDVLRDEAFLFLRHTVDAHLYCKDEAKREAATQLAYVLKPFRQANNKTYLENTSQIYKLILKLQEDKNAEAITTLGLDSVVADLEESNELFNSTFKTRSMEKWGRKSLSSMKHIRPLVDDAFKELVNYINVLYQANEIAYQDEAMRTALGNLIDKITTYIAEQNEILVRRGTMGASETPEPTPEPTPQPATPVIKRIYQKEGGNPDNPNEIKRGALIAIECENVHLLDATGENPGDLIFRSISDLDDKVATEDITKATPTLIEFYMINDLTEGNYQFRIETYYNGEGNPPLEEPVVITYPETLKLV